MKSFVLDANVSLRFLLADDAVQSPQAKALFEAAEAGKVKLILSHVAVAELVWVLTSFFEFPRLEVGTKLRGLVLHHGVEIENQDLVLGALDCFGRINADYTDCYAAALSAQTSHAVVTYDRDFRKFTEITWHSPAEAIENS
jgi:predicted nucleic-acid-binding protein